MKLNGGGGGQLGKRTKGTKGKKEQLTQRFGKRGEIGVGEGERGDLFDGGELFGDGCGKAGRRGLQGNRKRGF